MKPTHTAVVKLPEWIIETFTKCRNGILNLKDGTHIDRGMFEKNGNTISIHKLNSDAYDWRANVWRWKSEWLTDSTPIEEKKGELPACESQRVAPRYVYISEQDEEYLTSCEQDMHEDGFNRNWRMAILRILHQLHVTQVAKDNSPTQATASIPPPTSPEAVD